jgi:outer membrane protein
MFGMSQLMYTMTSLPRAMTTITFASLMLASVASTASAQSGASTSLPAPSSGPLRIAYINSQQILSQAPGRAEAEATFDKEMGVARAQEQMMEDSLKEMVAELSKDSPGLDSLKRESRTKAIQQRSEEFQHRAQDLNTKMQQRQAELAKPLMEQVSKVLDEFRAKGNYAMIFDVGAPASVVVSADKSLDITAQVLARLKELGPPTMQSTSVPPAQTPGPAQKPAGVTRPHG